MKKLLLLTLLSLTLTGCFNNGEKERLQQELNSVKQQQQELMAEIQAEKEAIKQAELEEEKAREEAEKAKTQQELEEAKAQAAAAEQKAKEATAAAEKAKNTLPKFGPGNMNGGGNPATGYVRVCTRSAKGELTLRSNYSQGSVAVKDNYGKNIYIPNGTTGIYYHGFSVQGEYTWYNVEYSPGGGSWAYFGWLRGDYLCS